MGGEIHVTNTEYLTRFFRKRTSLPFMIAGIELAGLIIVIIHL